MLIFFSGLSREQLIWLTLYMFPLFEEKYVGPDDIEQFELTHPNHIEKPEWKVRALLWRCVFAVREFDTELGEKG